MSIASQLPWIPKVRLIDGQNRRNHHDFLHSSPETAEKQAPFLLRNHKPSWLTPNSHTPPWLTPLLPFNLKAPCHGCPCCHPFVKSQICCTYCFTGKAFQCHFRVERPACPQLGKTAHVSATRSGSNQSPYKRSQHSSSSRLLHVVELPDFTGI